MQIRATSHRSIAVVLLAVVGIALAEPPSPAAAHAGGSQLPYTWWSADGNEVVGEWSAPADDAALIGTVVGVLRDGASEAYLGGPASDLPTADEVAALADSTELRTYLLDHVGVRQDGVACPGKVEPASDFLADGARFVFTCPRTVEQVELWVTVLQDQDPAYQTLSGDGTLQDARHTAAAPAQAWDFTPAAPATSRRAPLGLYFGLLMVVVAGAASLRLLTAPREATSS